MSNSLFPEDFNEENDFNDIFKQYINENGLEKFHEFIEDSNLIFIKEYYFVFLDYIFDFLKKNQDIVKKIGYKHKIKNTKNMVCAFLDILSTADISDDNIEDSDEQ